MNKTFSRIALTIAAMALGLGIAMSTASADDTAPASANNAVTDGKLKVKKLDFGEGSDIEGGVVSPDGDTVNVVGTLVHSNLIRVRQDFIPEIFKSAENL